MVVWSDNAISHITEFIDEAREETKGIAKSYMRKLVEYTDILDIMSKIGKKTKFFISDYEVRQIIYKKHRIFYNIKGNNVIILAVIHTRLDVEKALKKLKRDIS